MHSKSRHQLEYVSTAKDKLINTNRKGNITNKKTEKTIYIDNYNS